MAEIQEFAVGVEIVTATMTLPLASEEHYGPPFTISFYPGQAEIWIECEGGRQNLPVQHLAPIIKQMRRAAKLAEENAKKEQP